MLLSVQISESIPRKKKIIIPQDEGKELFSTLQKSPILPKYFFYHFSTPSSAFLKKIK